MPSLGNQRKWNLLTGFRARPPNEELLKKIVVQLIVLLLLEENPLLQILW